MSHLSELIDYHKKKAAYYKKILDYMTYYEPNKIEEYLDKVEYHLKVIERVKSEACRRKKDGLKKQEYPEGVKRIIEYRDLNINWSKISIKHSDIYKVHKKEDVLTEDALSWDHVLSAKRWIEDQEPVVVVEVEGEVRAYPMKLLLWNPVINDEIQGLPIVVVYCALCNLTTAYDRTVDGNILYFGASGFLRNSCLVLYDFETHSLWDAVKGEAIVGDYTGTRLTRIYTDVISFRSYKAYFPQGKIVTEVVNNKLRPIGKNPYVAYDDLEEPLFLAKPYDERLPAMERVVGLVINKKAICYPYATLEELRVVEDSFQEKDLVIFFQKGMVSPVSDKYVKSGKDIGTTGVFDPYIEEHHLSFYEENNKFYDYETKTEWSILGKGLEGQLKGKELTPIRHKDMFWYAWAAYHPETKIYRTDNS